LPNPRLLTSARIAKQSLKDGAKPERGGKNCVTK
jgi:hypothetical protein